MINITIKIDDGEDNIEFSSCINSLVWMDLFSKGFVPALRAFGYSIPPDVVDIMLEAREEYTNEVY